MDRRLAWLLFGRPVFFLIGALAARIKMGPGCLGEASLWPRNWFDRAVPLRFLHRLPVHLRHARGRSHSNRPSRVRARVFLLLNFISAAVWAAVFTALGFYFGHTVELILRRIFSPLHVVLLAALIGFGGISLWLWRIKRRPQEADPKVRS